MKRTDVHWVEEELLRVRQEVFLEVFRQVMEEIERQGSKRVRRCERCGSVLVRNGQERKQIKALVGVVRINRLRLGCQRCRDDRYPLDQALGLSARRRG